MIGINTSDCSFLKSLVAIQAAEDPYVVEKSSMIIISETETVQFSLNQFITLLTVTFAFLRGNVGKYQESQISSKLFEFRLIYTTKTTL